MRGHGFDSLADTKQSLYKGIDKLIEGNTIGDVSFAIQQHAESYKYGVVRELCGHGLGEKIHEEPQILAIKDSFY